VRPIHLNLAARPYRDYRPVYAVVVVASLLIAFLMLNNIDTYYRYVSDTQTTYQRIADLNRQAQAESGRALQAEGQLRGINLAALDQDTKFINARLAERAFSWSELLDRLEDVLPPDVRIRTIGPSFGKTFVHLELGCDAKASGGMLDTITRFMRDPHFANPFPRNESESATKTYMFAIGVDFKPSIARPVEK
jgi:hypothetical protein